MNVPVMSLTKKFQNILSLSTLAVLAIRFQDSIRYFQESKITLNANCISILGILEILTNTLTFRLPDGCN